MWKTDIVLSFLSVVTENGFKKSIHSSFFIFSDLITLNLFRKEIVIKRKLYLININLKRWRRRTSRNSKIGKLITISFRITIHPFIIWYIKYHHIIPILYSMFKYYLVSSRILKNMNLDAMLFIILKSDSLNLNHSLRLSLTIILFYLLTIILCWTPLQCSLYLWHLFWCLFLKTSPNTQTQMSSKQSFKWKGKKWFCTILFFNCGNKKKAWHTIPESIKLIFSLFCWILSVHMMPPS